ncbi:MAG: amidase [Candidatus Bathyarchaeia archaeon]
MTETSFEFNEVTADQLQEEMRSGRQTARSIAERYLNRIELLNRQGPSLRAVIELNPDALAIAEGLDRERKQKGPRGPLHGIPVLLKDNIDTADRMTTTAGSLALEGSTALEDAFLVQRLRMAGVVILGKANLSEWANFRSTHPVSGWSARGGQTRNPYALDRNPCGSSSGSAVALAANLCTLAVGTETDGSIVCPSAVNGIVGIKPTLGLVSRNGVVPIAHSQDTAGPMARTVRDATLLLNVLAGSDPDDPATVGHSADSELDYTRYLKSDGLRGVRLGIARQYFGSNTGVDRLIDDCITEMKRQGADIIDPVEFASYRRYDDSELEVMLYEFKNDLASYLRKRGDSVRVKSLADIIAFNEERRSEEMPYFEQEIMLKAEKKGPLSDEQYRIALARNHKLSRKEGIDAVIATDRLDAIVAPTTGPAWLTDWITGDHESGSCSTPAAVAGYPHISVPAGFVHGLPIGISFFGPAWSEPTLLRIAYSFEQATKARRPPSFLPTVGSTLS